MDPRKPRAAGATPVQDLVSERLLLLEPRARAVISCAALLGYHPEVALLVACCGEAADVTIDALERACALDLVVAEPRGHTRYRFRHALTQSAVRTSLGALTERALHAKIAAALESLPDASSRAEQLAHHWSSAGDSGKARSYCTLAAEDALRIGADDDAATFAKRAGDAAAR